MRIHLHGEEVFIARRFHLHGEEVFIARRFYSHGAGISMVSMLTLGGVYIVIHCKDVYMVRRLYGSEVDMVSSNLAICSRFLLYWMGSFVLCKDLKY